MRLAALALAGVCFCTAAADILHLRDGSRHHGELIRQTDTEVVFRVITAGGAEAIRSFRRNSVDHVELTDSPRPAERQTREVSDAPQYSERDFEQMAREAEELAADDDVAAALRALQRLANRAPADALSRLNERHRASTGRGLDEFMAQTRLRNALSPRGGSILDLPFATEFEAAALGRMLEQLQNQHLARNYQGRTIADWPVHRDEYSELKADAREMVDDARLIAAAIGARLHFDPRLKQDRSERRRLMELRDELGRFCAKIRAMQGFSALGGEADDKTDPAMLEQRRLQALQQAASQPAGEPPSDKTKTGEQP